MPSKLNELAEFLDNKIKQLETLKIEQPTLVEIQKDVDEFFGGKECSERQVRVYTEGLMAAKIVELEKTVDVLRNQLIK